MGLVGGKAPFLGWFSLVDTGKWFFTLLVW